MNPYGSGWVPVVGFCKRGTETCGSIGSEGYLSLLAWLISFTRRTLPPGAKPDMSQFHCKSVSQIMEGAGWKNRSTHLANRFPTNGDKLKYNISFSGFILKSNVPKTWGEDEEVWRPNMALALTSIKSVGRRIGYEPAPAGDLHSRRLGTHHCGCKSGTKGNVILQVCLGPQRHLCRSLHK